MTEPRLCPSCRRENAPDALFCVACDVRCCPSRAPRWTPTAVGECPRAVAARSCAVPRCLTRNTEPTRSTAGAACTSCAPPDAMDDAAPRPLTAALAKAANTGVTPRRSPFESESPGRGRGRRRHGRRGQGPPMSRSSSRTAPGPEDELVPPIAAATEDPETRPEVPERTARHPGARRASRPTRRLTDADLRRRHRDRARPERSRRRVRLGAAAAVVCPRRRRRVRGRPASSAPAMTMAPR